MTVSESSKFKHQKAFEISRKIKNQGIRICNHTLCCLKKFCPTSYPERHWRHLSMSYIKKWGTKKNKIDLSRNFANKYMIKFNESYSKPLGHTVEYRMIIRYLLVLTLILPFMNIFHQKATNNFYFNSIISSPWNKVTCHWPELKQ